MFTYDQSLVSGFASCWSSLCTCSNVSWFPLALAWEDSSLFVNTDALYCKCVLNQEESFAWTAPNYKDEGLKYETELTL